VKNLLFFAHAGAAARGKEKKLGTLRMRITFSMLVKLLFFFSREQIIQVERNKIEGITSQKSHQRKLAGILCCEQL